MGKLKALEVKNEKPDLKEKRISDGKGLFFRVRSSGAKSWLYCFRMPGKRDLQQMTLGSYPDVSLEEAREMIPQLRKLIKQGLDPRKIKAAEIATNSQAITMQNLFDKWISFLELTKTVTTDWVKAQKGRWNLHLKNTLGNILAKDITRAHLAIALEAMAQKGIKEETRKTLTTLNLMLDYALKHHFIEQNHARVLKPKDFAASASRPRDRVLTFDELRKLWAALNGEDPAKSSSMSIITATAIKLLILTGARRGEVAAMQWDEIDFKNSVWHLPAYKTKNKQAHFIYLSSFTKELLKSLKPFTGNSKYVFDTQLNLEGHIHTDALTRALRRLMKKDGQKNSKTHNNKKTNKIEIKLPPLAEMMPFTLHDIRRSVATALGEHLSVKPYVIERMLNHQPLNKLIRTYQRTTYAEDQKKAWLIWSDLVEHKIANEPGNVIQFKVKQAI